MTSGTATAFGGLLLLLLASKEQGRQPGSGGGGGSSTPPVGSGVQVPIVRTGESDFATWVRHRRALAVVTLASLEPPIANVDDVASAILAQWAHESAKGRSEFNYNLGGWTARPGDDYHAARDNLTGSAFRWTAYPDLPTAVEDQINRLRLTFPSAWRLLVMAPLEAGWIVELGRRGYYTASPQDYVHGWQAELANVRGVT